MSEPVDYDVELVPVEALQVGDVLRLKFETRQIIVMVDHVRPCVREDESGGEVSVYELIFGVVDGAKFAAMHPLAGTLVHRILPQPEPQ